VDLNHDAEPLMQKKVRNTQTAIEQLADVVVNVQQDCIMQAINTFELTVRGAKKIVLTNLDLSTPRTVTSGASKLHLLRGHRQGPAARQRVPAPKRGDACRRGL
jgi:hypothetical protein